MLKYLQQIWNSKDLRKKILYTIGILIVFRICTQVSIPGADLEAIRLVINRSQLLGIFSALTGGSAENFSIILMGLSPYINASIIIQLLTVIVPRLESLSKEGEQGRKRLNQYTRWLTIPIAFLQSYGMIVLINSQAQSAIIPDIQNVAVILPIMLTITAGTIFLMWLGELISEYGIGKNYSFCNDDSSNFYSSYNCNYDNGGPAADSHYLCRPRSKGQKRSRQSSYKNKPGRNDPYYLCSFNGIFPGSSGTAFPELSFTHIKSNCRCNSKIFPDAVTCIYDYIFRTYYRFHIFLRKHHLQPGSGC